MEYIKKIQKKGISFSSATSNLYFYCHKITNIPRPPGGGGQEGVRQNSWGRVTGYVRQINMRS
jgi:hypothetical protein